MFLFRSIYFYISIALIIISGFLGFLIGSRGLRTNISILPTADNNTSKSVFNTQSAVIRGRITEIDTQNNIITVTNTKGVTDSVPLSQTVYIVNYDTKGNAISSTNKEDLKENMDAVINLELDQSLLGQTNGKIEYKVIAVTYIPPLGSQNTQVSPPPKAN